MAWRPKYGANGPFCPEERDTLDSIINALHQLRTPKSEQVLYTIASHFQRLEEFGELLSRFPSPVTRHRLGNREQSLPSLAEGLCRSNPANFEFRVPTRAIVGRSLDMAKSNFYRLLRYGCDEVLEGELRLKLREEAIVRLREVIYTKLVEEVLTDIVSGPEVERSVRLNAVYALIHIWDRRLTYRTKEFFPLLQATWDARQRVRVVGGSLMGAQELFALMREGCDPAFIDYFVRPDPAEDEVLAFREFLFGATAEQLDTLQTQALPPNGELPSIPDYGGFSKIDDPGTLLYEFFRSRFLLATARRLANLPGPKRTAEGYVMLGFLSRVDEEAPVSEPSSPESVRVPWSHPPSA